MKAMLGFLTPQAKDAADALQSSKSAAAWLRELPALDVIGRQQHVIQALDATHFVVVTREPRLWTRRSARIAGS